MRHGVDTQCQTAHHGHALARQRRGELLGHLPAVVVGLSRTYQRRRTLILGEQGSGHEQEERGGS
jgi:hypothetical protein